MAWERDPGFRGRTPERLTESPNLALGREAGIRGLPRLPTADARSIRVVACLSQQTKHRKDESRGNVAQPAGPRSLRAGSERAAWPSGVTAAPPAVRGDRS